MAISATADVVVRSRKKGSQVFRDVQGQLDRLASRAKGFGLLAGAAAVGGVAALTAQAFKNADALAKQADRLGTSTSALKTMQHLTELTGGSSENLNKTFLKMQKALGEFNVTGSGTAAPFLRQMNLDTKALAQLRPEELFQKYGEEIRKLGTRSEQAAASAALFGDRSGEMLNLVDLGADAFAETQAEVDRYGLALDRVDSAKVEAANDAMLKIKERALGVGNTIAAKVAPIITAMANRFLDSGTEADAMGKIVDKAIDGIAFGVGVVADALFGWKIIFQAIKVASLLFVGAVVGGFAKVERAIIIVQNKMSDAFGGDQIDVRSGFLTRVEDSLRASSKEASDVLQTLIATERPSIGIAKALDDARIAGEKAAVAAAAQREQLQAIKPATFETNEIEDRAAASAEVAAAKELERQASKLQALELSLATETERQLFAFEQRQQIIDDAQVAGLISEDRAGKISEDLAISHEEKLTKIAIAGATERQKFEELSNRKKAQDIFSTLESITAGVATSNKTLFRINQASAIGNAIVNTYEGVTKTMAKYPYPFNLAFAAAHLAAGLAQISAIRSASFGGGTTPSLAGATPTFNDQPVIGTAASGIADSQPGVDQVPSSVTIIVQGSLIGDQSIREVISGTLGELIAADEIVIDPSSRQAEEIRQGSGSGG